MKKNFVRLLIGYLLYVTEVTTNPLPNQIKAIGTNTSGLDLLFRSLRIVGGEETSPHEFPWMARIAYNTVFLCGGSLISTTFVLTAAHCLYSPRLHRYAVFLGDHDLDESIGVRYQVTAKYSFPERKPPMPFGLSPNDIGLLQLREAVQFTHRIKPICLAAPGTTYDPEDVTVIGWGITETNYQSCRLRKVNLSVDSTDSCKRAYGRIRAFRKSFEIDHTVICASAPSRDSCNGDSGGPLFLKNRDKVFVQIGVVSFGPKKCGEPGKPGVYTNVSVYADWIRSITGNYRVCE